MNYTKRFQQLNKLNLIAIFVVFCSLPFLLETQSLHAHHSMENTVNESLAYPQQDVDEESHDNDPDSNLGYLFAVFAIVWGLFFAFMILLMRKQTRIDTEIAFLKQLLKKKGNP